MRLANVAGRAVLITSIGEPLTGVDVASASAGRFGPDLMGIYENLDRLPRLGRLRAVRCLQQSGPLRPGLSVTVAASGRGDRAQLL